MLRVGDDDLLITISVIAGIASGLDSHLHHARNPDFPSCDATLGIHLGLSLPSRTRDEPNIMTEALTGGSGGSNFPCPSCPP
jgi:hypothetical protein